MTRQGHAYTPKKTREAEIEVGQHVIDLQIGRAPGAVSLSVEFVMEVPKSWPKWKRDLAERGLYPHVTRPDGDNLLKLFKDALNGIAWKDDSSIQFVSYWKRYARKGEETCTRATLDSSPALPATLAQARDWERDSNLQATLWELLAKKARMEAQQQKVGTLTQTVTRRPPS